jgi:ligand-binding sensor domain-containing protein/serine phosphatase RsbU (regulator of sigma subunit)
MKIILPQNKIFAPVLSMVLFFCFVGAKNSIQAQSFKNYSSISGKKNVPVFVSLQDSHGLLWTGTKAGLVSYDGYEYKNYTGSNNLQESEVISLFEAEDKSIWIGHRNGKISIFKNKKFFAFELNNILPGTPINAIRQDKNGAVLIGTYGSGIYIFKDKHLIRFNSDSGLSDDFVYCIDMQDDGTAWVGTDHGISIFSVKNNSINPIKNITSKNGLPDNIIRAITHDRNGNIWLGSQDYGFFMYNRKQLSFFVPGICREWEKGAITSLIIDAHNRKWITTQNRGIIIYSGEEHVEKIDSKNGILSNEISGAYEDFEGNIWISTSKGLSLYYQSRFDLFTYRQGLLSDKIMAVYCDSQGAKWISSDLGLTKMFKEPGGEISYKYYFETKGVTSKQIVCIHEDKQKKLWLGTYGDGVYCFDPSSEKIETYSKKNGLASDNIVSISETADGAIWLASLGGGIARITDGKGANKIKNFSKEDGLISDYVYCVYTDVKNVLWCGTQGGGILTYSGNKFEAPGRQITNCKTAYSITEDTKGNIWLIDDDKGLCEYNGINFKSYSFSKDIKENVPAILTSDQEGNVIIADRKGINVLNQAKSQEITCYNYPEAEIEPNLNAYSFDGEGNIWIGTNSGLLKFRLTASETDNLLPRMFLSALKVQQDSYPIDSITQFQHEQNNFEFSYRAVWLKNPEKITYRYLLEGNDKTWSLETSNTIANYYNLLPGNYRFKVMASGGEGKWSIPAVYSFSIEAPFWQKGWFWVFTALFVVLNTFLFIQYRIRYLSREKVILEGKVEWRTEEIRQQSKIIEAKNKNITDSINYAQRLQTSLLPSIETIQNSIPESFILYLQKDIVSGDFYWFTQKGDISIIIAIDCTGHGVPGAFMSVIAYNLLNQIINEKETIVPSEILDELNVAVVKALHRNDADHNTNDGMDIIICAINFSENEVQFAGAMRPLYYFDDEKLVEIKGTKVSIGTLPETIGAPFKFVNHTIKTNGNQLFYLSTDGYADQFGGDKGGKLLAQNFRNLLSRIKSEPVHQQKELLLSAHKEWKGRYEQVDDILVIGFKA